ncbi:MAG: hypothetical protein OXC99_07365 [Chloroflexi bacterium]|nr:hypothetical protein [Chloroflexota bacterium]
MTRYWLIAPANYNNVQKFQLFWDYDKSNSVISIGWNIGDIASLDFEERLERFKERMPNDSKHGFHQLNKFYAIQEGDRIIARAGRRRIVGIGTATGPAFYSREHGGAMVGDMNTDTYENFLPIQWEDLSGIDFPNIAFGMHTVYEVTASKFTELTSGAIEADESLSSQVQDETGIPPEEQSSQTQTQFALEKYLEEFIVSNFGAVFGPDIQVYTDADGTSGKQYQTDVGRIDILAWEPGCNSFVVMELKKGRTSDRVVGQTLRYMGWVKEHLCKGDDGETEKGLRGMIICRDGDEDLEYALSVVDNVDIRFYRVDFQLSPTPYAS